MLTTLELISVRTLRIWTASREQSFKKNIRLQRCWLKMLDYVTIPLILKSIDVLRGFKDHAQ